MKNVRNLFLLLFIATLSSCSSSDEPQITEEERVRRLMTAATWKVQSVTIDGAEALELFPDLQVTFTANSFTTTNGGPVWPASGSWNFTNAQANAFTRSDDVEVTIETLDDQSFSCSLQWNETIFGGRRAALAGRHVFIFNK